MFGFVTSVRAVENTFMHTAITASGRYVVIAESKFKPGTVIEFSGTECKIDEDTTEVKTKSVKEASGKSLDSEKEKIDSFIKSNCVPLKTKPLINDAVIQKMSKTFDKAAATIMEAAFLRRPIIIRYDTDSDGLCAGLAIYEALLDSYNLKADEAMFPYYKNLNAEDDIRYFNSLEAEHLPPLLVCVDFGANPESREGYELVRAAGFSIIVIDHHPMHDPSVRELIDVLVSGIDAAPFDRVIHYTSGLLATEVAKRIKPLDIDWMARVAMAGDRSALITPTAKEQRHSEALMFALSTSKYKRDLDSFLRLVKDEEEMDFAYAQAEEKIQTVIEKLPTSTKKKTANGVAFFIVDASKLLSKGQYPSKAVIANIAMDALMSHLSEPAVLISWAGRGLSMRVNKPGLEAGLNSSAAIKVLKESMPESIEAGGGHPVSSAMRMKVGESRKVVDALIKEISSQRKA